MNDSGKDFYTFTFKAEDTGLLYVFTKIYLLDMATMLKSGKLFLPQKVVIKTGLKSADRILEKLKEQFNEKEIKTLDNQIELIRNNLQEITETESNQ